MLTNAKSIRFNTEMVRAILDGKKTVTRRIIKQNTMAILNSECRKNNPDVTDNQIISKLCFSPYQVGNILYVKEAARIFLRVTDVYVEKLHDITLEKAIKEGFENVEDFGKTIFSIYPQADGDTWVWVIEFEKMEGLGNE